ncbi:MAG TPA: Flp pilus assembly protein CpaB [Clostridia bacterium]|nr:Flp pilus assembly protein CpaB [Clostridia bacterium]
MNRNRLIMVGVLALAVAGFITFAGFRVVRKAIDGSKRPMTPVVVAAADLNVGQRLEERYLRTVEIPSSDLPSGVFNSVPEIVGRGVIVPMAKNELVLSNKLASEKAGAGLPSMIPTKMRAVSVKVNEVISVAGFVSPGTHVDVLLTGSPSARQGSSDVMTTTVLENVEVLAAGKEMQQNPEGGKPQQVTVITLLVSPDEAQKLALASNEGKIQLALRNPLDLDKSNPVAVRNVALYHAPALPEVAVKRIKAGPKKAVDVPPPQAYLVETIRGDKRDVTKF